MKTTQALYDLAKILCPDHTILKELQLAVDDPKKYGATYNEELEERGIETSNPSLPWLAFVDRLTHRNLVEELDWKSDFDDFIDTTLSLLEHITDTQDLKKQVQDLVPIEDDEDDIEAEDIMMYINEVLEAHQYTLIVIDIDSDSYPLCLVQAEEVTTIKELASQAGYGTIKIYNSTEVWW